MEWGINDSLKSRAYGLKKEADLDSKQDKVQNYEAQGGHYYPQDRDGKFDEWGAMVKHMTQRHQVMEKEKQEKHKKQQHEYLQFLDQQRLEKLQQKMQDQTLKKHEYDTMVEKNKVLKQLNDLEAVEQKGYQGYIKDQYIKKIDETEQKRKFDRDTEIDEEKHRQERIRKDMEIEKQRLVERRDQLKQEMDMTLKYKSIMTDAEKQNLERQRQEWQQLCEITAKKEVDREQNYKRFFKDFESDMQRRQNQHIDHVLTSEMTKQNKLDQIENTNTQKYREWLEQKEKFEKDIRDSGLKDMNETNKQKMDERQYRINQDKDEMKKVIEDRHLDEKDYRQYEKNVKDNDRERRKIYKDTLDHQMRLLDLQKVKYGTMTNEEKRMNRVDLQHYKTNDGNQFEAMIPGIHNLNTVGTSPLKRGARQILGGRGSTSDLHEREGSSERIGFGSSQSMKILPPYQTQIVMSNEIKQKIAESKEKAVNPDQYNPITNPIPWLNQNPYINKEKTFVKSSVRATSLFV